MKLAILPLVLILSIPIPPPEPPTHPPLPPVTFAPIKALVVGDSITCGANCGTTDAYRLEASRLLNKTGQPHQWIVAAVPGSKCSWWVTRLDALITTHHPDIIFLNCGTNDTPMDNTEGDYGAILTVASNRSVQVIASYIGRPDMQVNSYRPYIEDWMYNTNLAIQRALAAFPGVPVADMSRVPANPEFLRPVDLILGTPDGIHPNSWGNAAYGQLFYQAAAPSRGWKTLAQMGLVEMCGLSGTWRGQPWPTNYRVCRY